MNKKRRVASLVFGLVASFSIANAAQVVFQIVANGDPHIQLGFGDVVNFSYTVTNPDTEPHRMFFNNTYPPGAVRQLANGCNPTVPIAAGANCVLSLQIVGRGVPPGGIEGGPEVCVGTTVSACSVPKSFDRLVVNR